MFINQSLDNEKDILYFRCGHCKRMAPTYDELGRKFVGHDSVTIAKVDCTQEVNRALCNQQNVSIRYSSLPLAKRFVWLNVTALPIL